jgi:plastocyanin
MLTPGTYEFICTVGDHAGLGMKGTLTVVSK